jgi:hypothetical protein
MLSKHRGWLEQSMLRSSGCMRPNGLLSHLIELKRNSRCKKGEVQNRITRRTTMKTHALLNLHLVAGKVSMALPWLLVLAVFFSSPAFAQETWRLDPQLSIARLLLGSGPNALETGLARVSGDVVFDSNDLTDPSVNLKITPGNEAGADYAKMSFTSKRSVMTCTRASVHKCSEDDLPSKPHRDLIGAAG